MRSGRLAFAVAVLLGAGNFIGVRFSNRELDPFWGAGLRFGLAAALFVAFVVARRLEWPRGRALGFTAAYGALGTGLFFALMYWALVRVGAGVAAVVLAIVPLATLLLAAVEGQERIGRRAVVGAVLACSGIVWIALGDDLEIPLSALLVMVAAAAVMAQAVILGKWIAGNHPAVTNAVGMTVGAVLLLVLSVVAGETWALPSEPEVVTSVVYLVTFGSVGVFALLLVIVRVWTASATSYMFVLFPVVTMALDAVISGEPVTARGLVGALVVMAGVWFGAVSPAARRQVVPPPGEAAPCPPC